ncbi:hypothetical protein P7C70_g9202, partial [Phenoliferia sp. Uapishka_3]
MNTGPPNFDPRFPHLYPVLTPSPAWLLHQQQQAHFVQQEYARHHQFYPHPIANSFEYPYAPYYQAPAYPPSFEAQYQLPPAPPTPPTPSSPRVGEENLVLTYEAESYSPDRTEVITTTYPLDMSNELAVLYADVANMTVDRLKDTLRNVNATMRQTLKLSGVKSDLVS